MFQMRGSRTVAGTIARTILSFAVLVVVCLEPVWTADLVLPPALDRYLNMVVRPTASERRRLVAGEPVAKLLDGDTHVQVSVFGAIWIDAPIAQYVEAIRNIETFEQGKSFPITRRISSPPRAEDFSDMRLTDDVVTDLVACRVGDCPLKLDGPTIDALQTRIDWQSPQRHAAAEALMRRAALSYTQAYLAGGNARLPVYQDKPTPVSAADEFRAMVDDMPMLTAYMPSVHRYLLDYPSVGLPGATSFLYWQQVEFGLRPTLRISHLTIRESPENVVVASKMIYANHYFRSALELRLLIPDPARGPGFWFVTVVSSRTDGMTGFTGIFVRRKVRSEAREGTTMVLINTKKKLEKG
jgi:hypothetical protein